MYWGTAKWSPVEIFETFSMARTLHCIAPLCEYAEYHPFHREKVGTPIMGWARPRGLTSSHVTGWALHGRAVQQNWLGSDHLVPAKSRSLLLKTRGSVFSLHKTGRQGERRGNILFKAGNNIFTLSAERKIQQGWPRHAQPQWWPRAQWSDTASQTTRSGEFLFLWPGSIFHIVKQSFKTQFAWTLCKIHWRLCLLR